MVVKGKVGCVPDTFVGASGGYSSQYAATKGVLSCSETQLKIWTDSVIKDIIIQHQQT